MHEAQYNSSFWPTRVQEVSWAYGSFIGNRNLATGYIELAEDDLSSTLATNDLLKIQMCKTKPKQ